MQTVQAMRGRQIFLKVHIICSCWWNINISARTLVILNYFLVWEILRSGKKGIWPTKSVQMHLTWYYQWLSQTPICCHSHCETSKYNLCILYCFRQIYNDLFVMSELKRENLSWVQKVNLWLIQIGCNDTLSCFDINQRDHQQQHQIQQRSSSH